MQEAQQKLQTLLHSLFRADAADLDFGIYRIINFRRTQFETFINDELPKRVNAALDKNAGAEAARQELDERAATVRKTLGDDVLDADGNLINDAFANVPVVTDYLAAKAQHGSPRSREQREEAICNHLYTFFSRYYETGDFIPRRRYAQTERYAIPYNGEEIYLHWANREQYYVKSGEHFAAYQFTSQRMSVTFALRDIDVEKDNVQGTKRFFIPIADEVACTDAEIRIPFEFRPLTDAEKQRYTGTKQQDKIINAAEEDILKRVSSNFNALAALNRRIGDVTTLKKHLRAYTRGNTADFFIHKDLGGFLTRELDFYLKNEVVQLSTLLAENTKHTVSEGGGVESNQDEWLETARTVHAIATDIINFLAHIEEFQKRLWLKKKFVLSTHYCMTLDRVPEAFYPEIAENTAQRDAWKSLFSIDEINGTLIGADYSEPLTVDFLKQHPNLVLDTVHFDSDFKDRLLSRMPTLDADTDGVLIHGENFQALNLLTARYRESLKAIYIDPPYNTNASAILYKNDYKDSSWMSLMADRIPVSSELLSEKGILCVAIDDVEASNLRLLLQQLFGKGNELGIVAVCSNPGGRKRPTGFAPAHEYAMFFGMTETSQVGRLEWTAEQLESYSEIDERGQFGWRSLRKSGGPNVLRSSTPTLFYPLFVRDDYIRIPKMNWDSETREWKLSEHPRPGEKIVLPINAQGEEMTWGYGVKTLREMLASSELSATRDANDNVRIRFKRYLNEAGTLPTTWWSRKKYSATTHGTRFLTQLLGDNLAFLFPKSIHLVEDCLRACSVEKEDIVLDYFGGSGTTAHATINLNRQDGGTRKYILVEMGHHFDTVLKPRVMKAIYAEKWKDGKPVSRESRLSQFIKYQRIESYEDALNNIEFAETDDAPSLFNEHRLSYMLDMETRESPTFLNVEELKSPFSYQLKIVNGLTVGTQAVDLPETFNYLLGISVQTRRCFMDGARRYLVYRGIVGREQVTIIWRETAGWDSSDYERDYRFIEEHHLTEGVDKVYVNTNSVISGACVLDILFKRLMFEASSP